MANPQVTPIAENFHTGGFMVSEARGKLSRESGILLSGQANVLSGTVLGRKYTGGSAVAAALGTNTGNGTFGAIVVNPQALPGIYTVEFDDATHYIVNDPAGLEIGHGTTGGAFAGALGFTITAGGTAFVPGDSFKVTVSTGVFKYVVFDPTATDGSQNPAAILYIDKDATSADKAISVIVRQAEVNVNELVWGVNVTTQAQKTAALAILALANIIAR